MMNLNQIQHHTETHLVGLIGDMFTGVDLGKRFNVTRELDQWRSDIEDIWKIKKGLSSEHFTVFFDDEEIFTFADDDSMQQIDALFLKGFLQAYQSQRIFLSKELYREREQFEEDQKIKTQTAKKAQQTKDFEQLSNEEKHIATQVMEEVTKDKGHETAH